MGSLRENVLALADGADIQLYPYDLPKLHAFAIAVMALTLEAAAQECKRQYRLQERTGASDDVLAQCRRDTRAIRRLDHE